MEYAKITWLNCFLGICHFGISGLQSNLDSIWLSVAWWGLTSDGAGRTCALPVTMSAKPRHIGGSNSCKHMASEIVSI